jgi:hypothetical protein
MREYNITMSNSNKKREEAERKWKLRRQREQSAPSDARFVKPDNEIDQGSVPDEIKQAWDFVIHARFEACRAFSKPLSGQG